MGWAVVGCDGWGMLGVTSCTQGLDFIEIGAF